MEYLKRFSEHSGYTEYAVSPNLITPNVSYCEDNNEVHYNPNDNGKYVMFNFKRNSTDENLLKIRDKYYYVAFDEEEKYKEYKSEYYLNGIKLPDDYTFVSGYGSSIININDVDELNTIIEDQLSFQIKYSMPYLVNGLWDLEYIGDGNDVIPVDSVIIGSGITNIFNGTLTHTSDSRKYIFTNPNGIDITMGSSNLPFGNCYSLGEDKYAIFVPSGSEGNYQNFLQLGICNTIIPYDTIEEALSY